MLEFKEFRRIRKTYMDFETRDQCRQMYKLYKKQEERMNSVEVTCGTSITTAYIDSPKKARPKAGSLCSLDTVECVQSPASSLNWYCNQEKGNNPMNYATATVQAGTTETQDQRKYLAKRLEDVFYTKEAPLYAKFGLSDDDAPVGPKAIAERLAAGKYILKGVDKDDEFDGYRYWGIGDLIRWRDPAKKADLEGYEAAREDLKKARQVALDIIKIDEPKAGLEAVKTLEAWEPTGAAN